MDVNHTILYYQEELNGALSSCGSYQVACLEDRLAADICFWVVKGRGRRSDL